MTEESTAVIMNAKPLFSAVFILGSIFVQWNGQTCVSRGEELFKTYGIFKSVAVTAGIELVVIILSFRVEDIKDNSEGLIVFLILQLFSCGLMKSYDSLPLKSKGIDLSPSLMPVMLIILCLLVCKNGSQKLNTIIPSMFFMIGSFFITSGLNEHLTIYREDYLSFASIFLTVLKVLSLKQFREKNIRLSIRQNAVYLCSALVLLGVLILEFLGKSELGTFLLVTSISGLSSVGVLYILYNHVMSTKTLFETTIYLMFAYLCHQILQSQQINITFVVLGLCILIGSYVWHVHQQESDDSKALFKDMPVTSNELLTRIEFMLFLGGVLATFLYILPPRVSNRDIHNLSYVGLDKIFRKLLQKR